MKNNLYKMMQGGIVSVVSFAAAFMVACSSSDDKGVAGGTSEDAGIIADLNVAGVAQKGPFVKGSAVTVQGIDCKTMERTGERFEGEVDNDKGEFVVDSVTLSSTCAVFEVSGYYLNELTGKKSSEMLTLHALTNLKDRKNVNINVLTELEYERVMGLVTVEKNSFADAKKQAEKEVLASFNIKGNIAKSEDLNILEAGDGNAALLAVSVMVQASASEAKIAERLDEFSAAISQNGSLDSDTKKEIAKWATDAMANGKFDTIRKNIESWSYADSVPAFETYIKAVADGDSVTLSSSSFGTKAGMTSSSMDSIGSSSLQNDKSSSSIKDPRTSYLNPNINYGEMTDPRDGQVYKTVKIGDQIWMAQNLNYADSVKMPSLKGKSWCYGNDPEKCAIGGRLYTWAAAIDSVKLATDKDNPVDCGDGKLCGLIGPLQGVCPDGWLLPSEKEWSKMRSVVAEGVSQEKSGVLFKTKTGWSGNGNGTDVAGFSAIPAGYRNGSFVSWGSVAYFWSSAEDNGYLADWDYNPAIAHNRSVNTTDYWSMGGVRKSMGQSVRCVKGEVTPVFLEREESPKDTYLNPKIKYDSIVDPRDGKVYKTVKIGDHVWMAQNLSYKTTGRYCYKDSVKYCNIYGGLYTWSAAVGNSESECKSKESCKIQGICPDGWHMPDTTEWNKLYLSEGDSGYVLQAKGFKNWAFATDDYGFSALPAGNWFNDGYYNFGYTADFWMTTRKNGGEPYYWDLDYDAERTGFKTLISSQMRLSIRCLKDYDAVAPSSSSSESSSSVEVLPACKTDAEDNCEYGTLTDARDGQTYKTVKIGKQWWMAENLNYNFAEDGLDIRSYCYNDSAKYCEKYGALYTWAVAMDSAGLWSDDAKGCGYEAECSPKQPVQGICPAGWHMPDTTDWGVLRDILGENAGIMLKSQTAWYDDPQPGTDAVGFTALPGGLWYGILSEYEHESEAAYFWSTSSYKNIGVYYKSVGIDLHYLKTGLDYMNGRLSVRCLKN